MTPYTRILLFAGTLEGCEIAVDRAAAMARAAGVAVHVVDVVQDPAPFARALLPAEIFALLEARQHERLAAAADRLQSLGVSGSTEMRHGDVASELTRAAIEKQADLLIVPDTGARGGRRASFGPTDMRLLRQCACALWFIRPSAAAAYTRIGAAVAPETHDEAHTNLNTRLVETAVWMAQQNGATLRLLSAWGIFGEDLLMARLSRPAQARLARTLRDEARRSRDRFLARVGATVAAADAYFVKGDPGEVLPRLAQTHRLELLVMGTVARTGVAGLVMGNTAERVLRAVQCDVLALKPDGFVSPLAVD